MDRGCGSHLPHKQLLGCYAPTVALASTSLGWVGYANHEGLLASQAASPMVCLNRCLRLAPSLKQHLRHDAATSPHAALCWADWRPAVASLTMAAPLLRPSACVMSTQLRTLPYALNACSTSCAVALSGSCPTNNFGSGEHAAVPSIAVVTFALACAHAAPGSACERGDPPAFATILFACVLVRLPLSRALVS